ncbi:MAG: ABC transporter permease [Firmicutes bacterium]|nr:ABC transporter permease [Bacillota bacterium]MCL1953584.1 ABC transporter permease [Bacillota bacterium]
MFSKHIIKQSISSNWKLWALLTGLLSAITVLMMFSFISISNNPYNGIDDKLDIVPILAQAIFMPTLSMGSILMVILAIIIGNKLVAREIDSGSMSFVLNTQTTRLQVLLSKALVYFLMLFLFSVIVGLIVVIMASTAANLDVDMSLLASIVSGFVIYSFAISGFCFASSCWFNKVSFSLLIGAGLPLIFMIIGTIAPVFVETNLDLSNFLKSITVTTLFDINGIVKGDSFAVQFIILAVIGIAMYSIGIIKFLKKDLPL